MMMNSRGSGGGKKIDAMEIAKWILGFSMGILIAGALGFEAFNLSTSYYILNIMLGGDDIWGLIASLGLTAGLAFVDLGALSRILTPTTKGKDEPKFVWTLGAIWLIVGIANAALTWIWVANRMSMTRFVLPAAAFQVGEHFPEIIAGITYIVRIGFMYTLGIVLDHWMNHGASAGTMLGNAFFGSTSKKASASYPSSRPVSTVSSKSVSPQSQRVPAGMGGGSTGSMHRYNSMTNGGTGPMSARPGRADPNYHSLSGRPPTADDEDEDMDLKI